MINPSSLRVAHTGAYRVRFPVSGRAFLGRDYNVALLQGLTLLEVATYFFRFNSFWHLSQKIYSHSIVVWQQHSWLIQCFVLEPTVDDHPARALNTERALNQICKRFILNEHAMRFKVKYDHLVDKQIDKSSIVSERWETAYNSKKWLPFPNQLLFGRLHFQCQNSEIIYPRTWFPRVIRPVRRVRRSDPDEEPIYEQSWVAPLDFRWWYVKKHTSRWNNFGYDSNTYQRSSTYQYVRHGDGRIAFDKRVTTRRCAIMEHTWITEQVMKKKCQVTLARLAVALQPVNNQQAWFKKLSYYLNTEYQRVINNRVNFCWRLISSARHGNINLWLGLLALRVNQRGTYRARAIAFPLMSWAEQQEITTAGVQFRCAGRFTRKQRADYEVYRFGQHTSFNNLTRAVDQVFFTFPLKFGAIGITLTVNY